MSVDLLDDELLRFPEPAREGAEHDTIRGAVPSVVGPSATISGTCAVCEERPASVRCVNCERSVCKQDHWTMLGLCKGCASDDEVLRARSARPDPPPDLGIKWIEE